MKKITILCIFTFILLCGFSPRAQCAGSDIESLGKRIVLDALDKLDVKPEEPQACFTNAGYAMHNKEATIILYDVISKLSPISIGKGNLLPVHSGCDESLWFAFVTKKDDDKLMMTLATMTDHSYRLTDPINVRVNWGQDYKAFNKILGTKTFSLVGLANGWADQIPAELMQGALFHDHLCCGVFSGYFTVRFILENLPLSEGDNYTYIGAPAWCQDDYIMRQLNLTPGKHGYYTMGYPWSRPWKSGGKVYDKLGGIIIRYNKKKNIGTAYLLRFDWQENEFAKYIGRPDYKVNWKGASWLHVLYNRFFVEHLEEPKFFVTVLKEKKLTGQQDLEKLTNMGANPLTEFLGPDEEWISELK